MKIEGTIKIGDLLTSVTIIISVVALVLTWTKDRIARETQQADLVRSAAASAITKLDRWQTLQLSLYEELQPEFVITSEKLSEDFDTVKVRDYLWKTISTKRIQIASKILDEEISTSYIDLLAHFPRTRGLFVDLFRTLSDTEESISGSFQEETQQDVLSFEGNKANYTSAMLGNALRSTAQKHKERFSELSTSAIKPVREFLFDIISKSNAQILNESRN